VVGAFFLIRREAFKALGGFDERFFVYLEDLDLSARIKAAGLRERFVASTCIRHKGGGRAGTLDADRLYFSRQSRLRYCRKHFGMTAAVLTALLSLTFEPAIRLPVILWRGGLGGLREDAQAWARLAIDLFRRPRWLLAGETANTDKG
jgi:GT2 family glycosyltransferase